MVKDGRFEIRVDSEVSEGIRKFAEEDGRSVSDYVRRVLIDHLKDKAKTK